MHKNPAAYRCKHCKTTETIPYNEFGIKTQELTAVYCPKCSAKGKKRKMVRQK